MEERLDMAAQSQPVTEHASDEAATSGTEPSASHTPGPWTVCDPNGRVISTTTWDTICEINTTPGRTLDDQPAVEDANARLIAATPTLLATLKRNRAALDLIDPMRPLQYATTMDLMRRDMDAAIAAAESRS